MTAIELSLDPVTVCDKCDECNESNCSVEHQAAAAMIQEMDGEGCPGFTPFTAGDGDEWSKIIEAREVLLSKQGKL